MSSVWGRTQRRHSSFVARVWVACCPATPAAPQWARKGPPASKGGARRPGLRARVLNGPPARTIKRRKVACVPGHRVPDDVTRKPRSQVVSAQGGTRVRGGGEAPRRVLFEQGTGST